MLPSGRIGLNRRRCFIGRPRFVPATFRRGKPACGAPPSKGGRIHVFPLAVLVYGASLLSPQAHTIHLHAGAIDTSRPAAAMARAATEVLPGCRLHLVQFPGPIQPEWVAQLQEQGWQIVDYIPDNAYLVYGEAAARQALRTRGTPLQWEGAYLARDKIHPQARMSGGLFCVQLVSDEAANPETVALLISLAKEPLKRNNVFRHYRNLIARIDPAALDAVAARPDVISILPYAAPRKMDERQGVILAGQLSGNAPAGPGYLAWLASRGFRQQQFITSGLVVDVADSGIDNGTTIPGHAGLYVSGNTGLASRVAYARLEGTPNTSSTLAGCDGHGPLTGHIIGGYNDRATGFPHQDSAGYRYGLGIAPFVRLGSSVIFDPVDWTMPDFEDMFSRAYSDGARISCDSWGGVENGIYDADAQTFDALVRDVQPAGSAVPAAGNQGMVFVMPAGNGGSSAQTISSPGTAKNVITVGAAENVRSLASGQGGGNAAGTDGCGFGDPAADNANEIAVYSSRGPCTDGRGKPELVAPGTHVTGGVPQAPTPLDTGMALACYDASWICALPGGGSAGNVSNFFPLGQQWYSTGSGTSHATAAAAGGAALVWQYFVNRGWGVPSPAMMKAYLMNSTRYLTGTNANDTLWSSAQGMGMVDLDRAFDGTPRLLRDQQGVDTFTNSGTSRSFTGAVCKAYLPVRITLSWTDAPGSTAGNAYKNDLNLSVKADGKTYLGNVFTGAFSTTGGVADVRNNVESVFLPPGTTGLVEITVTAFNINSDGVPNVPPTLDQDFALVAYNLAAVNISAINKVSATNYATRLLSMTNTQYRLEFTRNLATNPVLWTPIVTNAGTGGEITLIDSGNGMDPKRYYRVVQP